MAPQFQSLIPKIQRLCQSHKVTTLFAFGSVLRDDFRPDSDVDMVVDIDATDPYSYTDYYFSLKEELEELFGRPIDLLEQRALKNPYFISELERSKLLIYGR